MKVVFQIRHTFVRKKRSQVIQSGCYDWAVALLTQRFDSRDLTNYLSDCLSVSSTLCLCNIYLHHYLCRCGGWTNLPTTIWATLNIRPPFWTFRPYSLPSKAVTNVVVVVRHHDAITSNYFHTKMIKKSNRQPLNNQKPKQTKFS